MSATTTPASRHALRTKVLVVEDEPDLQEVLRYNLRRNGFDVLCVDSGEQALSMLEDEELGLILLDLMLPGMDGLEVCRAIRSQGSEAGGRVPIVMVTAKGEEADVVAGLELGADDYVTKPFSPRELIARLKAVLRRGHGATAEGHAAKDDATIRIQGLLIHPTRHEVFAEDEPVALTATEFKLLTKLARSPGRVFTRTQIIESIHEGIAAVTDRSVDVLIVSLRRKLGETAGQNIQTVRGVGYKFKD